MNRKAIGVRITVIVLIALAAFIVAQRLQGYRKPIQRDVSIYAVIGHELLRGRPLYSDLLELRPPAVMVTFAVGEAIVGYGRHTIFLLYVTATITLCSECSTPHQWAKGGRPPGYGRRRSGPFSPAVTALRRASLIRKFS